MKKSSPSEFVAHAEQVLRRIDMYVQSGDTAIPKVHIEHMIPRIKKMQEAAANARLPPKEVRYKELTHMINDEWPLGHSLGNTIAELEDEYTRL